jgi:hypothetical protein
MRMFNDSDYHDQMQLVLADPKVTVINTFTPQACANDWGEFTWRFHQDNTVECEVSGGGHFRHQLWDYGHDFLRVPQRAGGLMDEITGWVFYYVNRKMIDLDHTMILLTPYRVVSGRILPLLVSGQEMQYCQVVQGAYARIRVVTQRGLMVSTSPVGDYCCATIHAADDDALKLLTRAASSRSLTVGMVRSQLREAELSFSQAMVLADYHTATQNRPQVAFFQPALRVHNYQHFTEAHPVDGESKPSQVAFMPGFVDGAYAPDKCYGNDDEMVRGRITDLQKTCNLDAFTCVVMVEFWQCMVPDQRVHTLLPYGEGEAYLRLKRPTQKMLWEEALCFGDGLEEDMALFMKAESYADPKTPRPIAVYGATSRVKWACYMYSLLDYLTVHCPWYAFGRTPLKIAEHIAKGAMTAQSACDADAHRLDGNISNVSRTSERYGLLRLFHTSVHNELLDVSERQFGQHGRTREGVHFEQEFGRGSGSHETAPLNSIDTATMCFGGYRRMKDSNGSYIDAGRAYAMLNRGLIGGDDSILFDMDADCLVLSAATHGQLFEANITKRGNIGVNFLARFYTEEVWYGETFNCCDILRQLRKLHVSAPLNGDWTPLRKAKMKALSLHLTDPYTHVVGPWSAEFLRHVVAAEEIARVEQQALILG